MPHANILTCRDVGLWHCKFVVQQVVELFLACPLVVLYNMSVAGVRTVEFGIKQHMGTGIGSTLKTPMQYQIIRRFHSISGWAIQGFVSTTDMYSRRTPACHQCGTQFVSR